MSRPSSNSNRWDIRASSTSSTNGCSLSTGGHPYKLTKTGGNQISIDTLPEQGTIPMSRNMIAANWAPADPAICRIHAEWRVTDRKARLVLWQELAECKTGEKPEFKTVLDRREK